MFRKPWCFGRDQVRTPCRLYRNYLRLYNIPWYTEAPGPEPRYCCRHSRGPTWSMFNRDFVGSGRQSSKGAIVHALSGRGWLCAQHMPVGGGQAKERARASGTGDLTAWAWAWGWDWGWGSQEKNKIKRRTRASKCAEAEQTRTIAREVTCHFRPRVSSMKCTWVAQVQT